MRRRAALLVAAVTLLTAGCAGPLRLAHGSACPAPSGRPAPGVTEALCKHCNCIMRVAEDQWEHECNVCNCKKSFKACLR